MAVVAATTEVVAVAPMAAAADIANLHGVALKDEAGWSSSSARYF